MVERCNCVYRRRIPGGQLSSMALALQHPPFGAKCSCSTITCDLGQEIQSQCERDNEAEERFPTNVDLDIHAYNRLKT